MLILKKINQNKWITKHISAEENFLSGSKNLLNINESAGRNFLVRNTEHVTEMCSNHIHPSNLIPKITHPSDTHPPGCNP